MNCPCIRNNNCNCARPFCGSFIPLSGSSESLGQPTDHGDAASEESSDAKGNVTQPPPGELILSGDVLSGTLPRTTSSEESTRFTPSGGDFGMRGRTKSTTGSFRETATGRSEGKCPTKGIDLRAKLSGADAKRIGSRPAVELRFNQGRLFCVC